MKIKLKTTYFFQYATSTEIKIILELYRTNAVMLSIAFELLGQVFISKKLLKLTKVRYLIPE